MVAVKKNVHSQVMETGKVRHYRLIIPILAMLVLSAHALRRGDAGLTASLAALAGIMFTRRAWIRLVVAAVFLWGGYAWADATVDFISIRQALDLPWKRLAAVMTGVILFDGLALAVMLGRRMEQYFTRGADEAWVRASIFVLVVAGLAMARHNVPFPVLLADRYLPGWGWFEIFGLALYAQWIGGHMLRPQGHGKYRPRIWGLFSAVFFLQLGLGLLGMDRMLMTGTLHLPVPALIVAGPVFRGGGFFMLVLFSVTVLLVGPAWCSHLCYIGAWDDAMSRLGGRPAPNGTLGRLGVAGRVTTLVLAVATAYGLRAVGVPGATAVLFGAGFGLAGVGVMVFLSRRTGVMAHCTAFCPMGLIANVFGRISPWRIRIGADCTRCGACYSRCRYNALDEIRVEQGAPGLSCTLCGDCVSACAHKQIGYRFPGLSSDHARTVFIVLVVALHAVFLGVARI